MGSKTPQHLISLEFYVNLRNIKTNNIVNSFRCKGEGTRVAELVKCPTLDFGSGRDLMAHEFEPHVGLYAESTELGACFGFCVSLSLCPSSAHAVSPSKINKH